MSSSSSLEAETVSSLASISGPSKSEENKDNNDEVESAADSQSQMEEVVIDTDKADHTFLKDRELKLVHHIGNEDFSTLGLMKAKKIYRASRQLDLVDLCAAIRKYYPEFTKSSSGVTGPKTKITSVRFGQVGVLLKGLLIVFRTQLQACKRTLLVDFERLKGPSRLEEIGLSTDSPVKKKTKKQNKLVRIEIGDNFGVCNLETHPSGSPDQMPRAPGGGRLLDSAAVNPTVPAEEESQEMNKQPGSKKRKKIKRVTEKDIMKMLEERGNELGQNAAGTMLPGAEIDLPQGGGDAFGLFESCCFGGDERRENDDLPKDKDRGFEKSPPTRKPKDDVPQAPRKRARREDAVDKTRSSFELSPLHGSNDVNEKEGRIPRRRRLIFNKIDKNPTISLQTLAKGQKRCDPDDIRLRLKDHIVQSPKTRNLLGFDIISHSGRKVASEALNCLIKESMPKPTQVTRHAAAEGDSQSQGRKKKNRKRSAVADMEMEVEMGRTSVDLQGLGQSGEAEALPEEAAVLRAPENLGPSVLDGDDVLNFQFSQTEHEHMVPLPAEPVINSQGTGTQEKFRREVQGGPRATMKPFTQLIGDNNASRKKVAHVFGVLLKMQGVRKIVLHQEEAYGPLYIERLELRANTNSRG